jgi:two-component system phosphate regulon sensor histidine kinase PhoR
MANWGTVLLRLALLGLFGLLVGGLYDMPLAGLLIASLAALGWHLTWLYRLDKWLRGEKMAVLPEGSGVWPRVFARIDFLRRRGRRRGRRFKSLLKQLRQATRTFPDAGVILNDRDEIVVFNRAARDLLGLKKRDRGLRIENLLRDPAFVAYLRSDDALAPVEIVSPMDSEQWLSCHAVPYGFNQKMLLVRDITDRRKVEDMRRDFVANASHELRTPLTVIAGYLDALADDTALVPELKQPVNEMLIQTSRMRQLVDELLRLSELETEHAVTGREAVNIRAIIETARQEALSMTGSPKYVEALFDSDADLVGNARDIQSVVSNLVSNAARYTPADGKICIRWWTDEDGGYVSVADTGKGIAKEHLPRLCERFYRAEDGRERVGDQGGTGLGLAIVKHALTRHGAELKIVSEPGKGSVFTCHFPVSSLVAVV